MPLTTSDDFQRLLREALEEVARDAFGENAPYAIAKVRATPRLRAEAVRRARARAGAPKGSEAHGE